MPQNCISRIVRVCDYRAAVCSFQPFPRRIVSVKLGLPRAAGLLCSRR